MDWFTADTHLDHMSILVHQKRPYTSIEEMNDVLIENINKVVKPRDRLFHLGDFVWKASRFGHFRHRLLVKELWVTYGNHDARSLKKFVSWAGEVAFVKINDQYFHLCHYPILSWRKREHGGFHLYGHSHGMFEGWLDKNFPGRLAIDIGVDNAFNLLGEYRPFSLDEVLEKIKNKSTSGVDADPRVKYNDVQLPL